MRKFSTNTSVPAISRLAGDQGGGLTLGSTRPFHFATPVWGRAYTDLFVKVGLPTLLAEGNLPAVSARTSCRYRIFTTEDDAPLIEKANSVHRLKDLMDVEISLIADGGSPDYEKASRCFERSIQQAGAVGAALVSMSPDAIVSAGSLERVLALVDGGKRLILTAVPRVSKTPGTIDRLLDHCSSSDRSISMTGPQMVEFALSCLHPISRSLFHDCENFNSHPSHLYWRVGDEGLVARCFHMHPLCIVPDYEAARFRSTIDDDYVRLAFPDPETVHVVADSDEIFVAELSAPSHLVGNDSAGKFTAAAVASWAERHANSMHRHMFDTSIRVHRKPMSQAVWRNAEVEADRTAGEIRDLLARPGLSLAIRDPISFIRRIVRRAQDTDAPAGSDRRLTLARALKRGWARVALRVFGLGIAWHEFFRDWHKRNSGRIYGRPPDTYPWHYRWLSLTAVTRMLAPDLGRLRGRVLYIVRGDGELGTLIGGESGPGFSISVGAGPIPGVDVAAPEDGPLPFADGAMDAAVCLALPPENCDPRALLAEMGRVLRPGGRLVVNRPAWANDETRPMAADALARLLPPGMHALKFLARGGRASIFGSRFFERVATAPMVPRTLLLPIVPLIFFSAICLNALFRLVDVFLDPDRWGAANVAVVAEKRL